MKKYGEEASNIVSSILKDSKLRQRKEKKRQSQQGFENEEIPIKEDQQMSARKDNYKRVKAEVRATLKSLKSKKFRRFKRHLCKKIDKSVKKMGVKDLVAVLMKKYGEEASNIVSSILKDSK
ncbi:hypothetical protein J4Q44_G00180550, partial [Coregonus suidteri]